MMLLALATSIYCATMSLGIVAFFLHRRFGKLHHIAYFFSCVSALIVLIQIWLITPQNTLEHTLLKTILLAPTIIALAMMPRTTPYRRNHTWMGCLGLCGYIALWVWHSIAPH